MSQVEIEFKHCSGCRVATVKTGGCNLIKCMSKLPKCPCGRETLNPSKEDLIDTIPVTCTNCIDSYTILKSLAHPMPQIRDREDWRVKHNECAQSVTQFLSTHQKYNYSTSKGLITLVTIGVTKNISQPVSELITALVGCPFSNIEEWELGIVTEHEEKKRINKHEKYEWIEVNVNSNTKTTELTLNKRKRKSSSTAVCARVSKSNNHRQLRVSDLLDVLAAEKQRRFLSCGSSEHDKLLLLINEDLFHENDDLFVAGLARLGPGSGFSSIPTSGPGSGSNIAVFSTYRYALNFSFNKADSYWFDCTPAANLNWEYSTELIRRLGRLGAHELLHLFNIQHCLHYECMMNGSGHLEEDFRQPLLLCPVDLYKVASLNAFQAPQQLLERYLIPLHATLCRLQLKMEADQVQIMLQLLPRSI